MAYLGMRQASGAVSADNPLLAGGWTAAFTPDVLRINTGFEVYHISILGPALASCSFQVWLDSTFYSNVVRGDINDWDPSQPMHVTPGQTIYFYWNTAVAPPNRTTPLVSIFCREASPI